MPGWLKILLILFAIGALLVVGFSVAGYYYFREHRAELKARAQEATDEGKTFGTGKVANACVDEALSRVRKDPGFMTQIRAQIFMQGCVTTAAPSPELCAGVPPAGEIMATVRWSADQCKRRDMAGSQPCGQLFNVVAASCQKTSK